MLLGKRILAVVPARGGSKGVPLKNIRRVLGLPLIAYSARTILECTFIDRAVVSTDHPEIAREAALEGLEAPFVRPTHLSGDRIGDLEVLVNALQTMEDLDACRYDLVLMLQPTSPMRTAEMIQETSTKLIAENLDAVWTVSPTDTKFHPMKQLFLRDGKLTYFAPAGKFIVARQQLEPIYHRNGMVYAFSRSCLVDQKEILGENSGAIITHGETIDIDNLADFEHFEYALQNRLNGMQKQDAFQGKASV